MSDRELFEYGRRMYKKRRWRESLNTHLQLIANGVHASYGFYGIELIRLAHSDLAVARTELLNCVRLQPNHADAHYYLGEIARVRGKYRCPCALPQRPSATQHHSPPGDRPRPGDLMIERMSALNFNGRERAAPFRGLFWSDWLFHTWDPQVVGKNHNGE